VIQLQSRRREINRLPLEDIQWVDEGIVLDIPPAWIDNFAFCGLNNTDFIDMEIYLHGMGEDPESRFSENVKEFQVEHKAWTIRKNEGHRKMLDELCQKMNAKGKLTPEDCLHIHEAENDFLDHLRDNKYFSQK
jgi:hypothetical protein